MADYPATLPLCKGSQLLWIDTLVMSRADNNAPKGRRLGPSKKRGFKIVHTDITDAQFAAFEVFYDANRSSSGFNFTWYGGTVYTVIFSETQMTIDPKGNGHWDVTLVLLQT